MMDNNLKREIMLDHYSNPNNKKTIQDKNYICVHNASDSCIDDITVYLLIENDVIKNAKFDGVGCTICTSSTDIMCDLIIGKTIDEAQAIFKEYHLMLDEKPFDDEILDEANAFDSLYKQANRIKCGTIGIHSLEQAIEQYGK